MEEWVRGMQAFQGRLSWGWETWLESCRMSRSYADQERGKAEKSGQGLGGEKKLSGGIVMEVRRVTATGEVGAPRSQGVLPAMLRTSFWGPWEAPEGNKQQEEGADWPFTRVYMLSVWRVGWRPASEAEREGGRLLGPQTGTLRLWGWEERTRE